VRRSGIGGSTAGVVDEGVQNAVTIVDDPGVADPFSPQTIAGRLSNLYRSLNTYERQSLGTKADLLSFVPGGVDGIARLNDGEVVELWASVVANLVFRRLEAVLRVHGIPFPIYPMGDSDQPPVPPVRVWDPPPGPVGRREQWSLLGREVGFPIGVPVSDLTRNAEWIEYMARRGFHVLTYRTVRNEPREADPVDWVLVDGIDEPWSSPEEAPQKVRRTPPRTVASQSEVRRISVPPDLRKVSSATSYAAPSSSWETWAKDIRDARRRLDALGGEHMLIVSVIDSFAGNGEKTTEWLAEDFALVAERAVEAGADAVECYLARATLPPQFGEQQACEKSVDTSLAIMRAVRGRLPTTRLLVKLSAGLTDEQLAGIVLPLASEGVIDGVSGISPVEVGAVTDGIGAVDLWTGHRPGVAGYALRDLSRDFVRKLVEIRRRSGLSFDIIAMGGVMTAEEVVELLLLGADAVQSSTGANLDPDLAQTSRAAYRASVEAIEVWDGFIVSVDAARQEFRARVSPEGRQDDMETTFGFDEVHPAQRSEIAEGRYLRWTTGWEAVGRDLVRRSALRLVSPLALTEERRRETDELAAWVAREFDPDIGVG